MPEELRCVMLAAEIWDTFLMLPDRKMDDDTDIRKAVHSIQEHFAYRAMRRKHPGFWR
jgi:hypothetical protein